MGWGKAVLVGLVCSFGLADAASAGSAFTIRDAIDQAIHTNPNVGEASANRRATEAEWHQSQGVLLPQVRLEASAGPEKLTRYITPTPTDNGSWLRGREGSIIVRQKLFDGLASVEEIWRQAARVDAAAFRVHERTELTALDAAEAYIDVVRYTKLVSLAEENVRNHRRVYDNVRARFSGGRSGEGDLQQAIERLSNAESTLAEFRQSLQDAQAKYRKTVGLEPFNLRFPGRLPNLPHNRDESLAVALQYNPTIKAAGADVAAARYGFRATAGSFLPEISLEGRATRGQDSITYSGQYDEASGKVVLSWDIFDGGQNSWKRKEAAEHLIQSSMAEARLQREAFESLDKAWNARTVTNDRIKSLLRDVEAGRKVIAVYSKEYELGQRSLLDLLTAESQYFNSSVSLVSARGVAVFADYQLLAVMGKLLVYLKEPHPADAEPLDVAGLHIFQFALPPVIIQEPDAGPKPLKFIPANIERPLGQRADSAVGQKSVASNFDQRWEAAQQPSPSALPELFRSWLAEGQIPGVTVAGLAKDQAQDWSRMLVLSYAQ